LWRKGNAKSIWKNSSVNRPRRADVFGARESIRLIVFNAGIFSSASLPQRSWDAKE
jgi:hypothetical protein